MVSPQERHTRVGAPSGTALAELKGEGRGVHVDFGMCDSTEASGSATELSATGAWHRTAAGDGSDISRLPRYAMRRDYPFDALVKFNAAGA
jgi:hypothetical protein